MKIKDIVLDLLNETALFEMAFERKVAIQKARNLQLQVARHLVKIVMYADSKYVNHWCKEINGWLWDIQDTRLKNNQKPLDYDTLFKILVTEPMGTLNDVQVLMNRNFKEYPDLNISQPDAAIVHKFLHDVISAACRDIASCKFTSIEKYL